MFTKLLKLINFIELILNLWEKVGGARARDRAHSLASKIDRKKEKEKSQTWGNRRYADYENFFPLNDENIHGLTSTLLNNKQTNFCETVKLKQYFECLN